MALVKAMEQEVNHQITAVTIVDEYRDRERRKFNMVIYIVSESEAEREIEMISLLLLGIATKIYGFLKICTLKITF